jgi:uncharacterized protein (TIGR02722 family)
MKRLATVGLVLAAGMLISGCAAFRMSVREQDPEQSPALTARYDQNDLLRWGKEISDDILAHPFIKNADARPIVVVMGIQNRTKTHMDMKAISDTVTTALLDAGRVRLINAARRDDLLQEQGYQLHNCPEDKRVQIGKQLGAEYMLTGSLVEIEQESGRQVRVSKQQDVYYQLTVELTDLQTGEIALRKQRDRLRRASKPLIGW